MNRGKSFHIGLRRCQNVNLRKFTSLMIFGNENLCEKKEDAQKGSVTLNQISMILLYILYIRLSNRTYVQYLMHKICTIPHALYPYVSYNRTHICGT